MFTKILAITAIAVCAFAQKPESPSYSPINFNSASHQAAPTPAYHAPAVIKAPVYHVAPTPAVGSHHEQYQNAHPQYTFEYAVKDEETHDIHNQHEERDGDVVKGYYSLVQPDGVTRIVHYSADHHNGFNAHVEYSGHADHPQVQKAKAAPVYHAPASVHHAYPHH